MLLKSHCWRHLVKCTKNFVFKLTCTARHASRWFINTGLKGGSFQLVSASHFCCTQQLCWHHGHLWLWKIQCSYWHQKNRSECLRGLSQAPHCPPLAWSLPLAPAFPSTLHLENSAPFPRHKAMEKKIPFFFILDITMDQIHTHLRDQDYLQSPSSKPCPFAHSPKCMYLFSSRHTGALHTMNIHLVTRETGKQTEAGATWARAWTCCEGEVL